MDKALRRLMGISLEFNRLLSSEKDISVSEYLVSNGIPFCHYATYQKMLAGEYTKEVLYYEMMDNYHMTFNYDEACQQELKKRYVAIKRDIEFINKEELAIDLQHAKEMMKSKKDVYPHKIEYFILEQLERFYVFNEVLDDKEIRVLAWVLKVAASKSRAILIHLIYFNTHRKKALISSLKLTFESLPLFDKEEFLIRLVITRQMIYEKEFAMALSIAKQLEDICIKEENYSCLLEVYQNMIAIYGCIQKSEKVDYYMNALKKLLNSDKKLSAHAVYQSLYYIGMCSFNDHDFEEAYAFLKKCVEDNSKSPALILFYLCTASYLGKKDIPFKVEDIPLDDLDATYKVFLRYFVYQQNGRSKKELKNYIANKIIPLVSEDYIMEAHVFRQELYLMKAKEEFALFTEKMNTLNYVILQNWEEVFLNL